jgi:hypothetical protein
VRPREKEIELLGGIPQQFVAFGPVHRELRIVVTVVRGRQCGDRGPDVVSGVGGVDVPGRHSGHRHGAQNQDRGRVDLIIGPADLFIGDLAGQHDAAGRRAGIRREEPQ